MAKLGSILLKLIIKLLVNGGTGILILLILLIPLYLRHLPQLDIWHTRILASEFTKESPVDTFEAYRDLENKLFSELEQEICRTLPSPPLNRFYKNSLSHPASQAKNWNQTFVLEKKSPRAGVLLLHGMSDSPYSLRLIGQRLHAEGAFIIGLRLPGHGTAPSGLLHTTWEDMAAAVTLTMDYLKRQVPEGPLYIVGYSNGGALGLLHVLLGLQNPDLVPIDGLVLISPAIGVTPLAGLAKWQNKISRLPGFEKLAWTDILPEYNPYKYESFPVNAGAQVHGLAKKVQQLLTTPPTSTVLEKLPPILAFQSIVDATVSTPALVKNLFNRLPGGTHELVVFDINQTFALKSLISNNPVPAVHDLMTKNKLNFTLSLITNQNKEDRNVVLIKKSGKEPTRTDLGMTWPRGLYSLSHVALPFDESDPLYGRPVNSDSLNIGNASLRGERGILAIPASHILRLKWNPFYPYIETRILEMIFKTRPILPLQAMETLPN
jgi:alpha-beta hydrolase superfamily lysophospholipase